MLIIHEDVVLSSCVKQQTNDIVKNFFGLKFCCAQLFFWYLRTSMIPLVFRLAAVIPGLFTKTQILLVNRLQNTVVDKLLLATGEGTPNLRMETCVKNKQQIGWNDVWHNCIYIKRFLLASCKQSCPGRATPRWNRRCRHTCVWMCLHLQMQWVETRCAQFWFN